MMRISVYCGSRVGNHDSYVQGAQELGRKLAAAGIGIVYGGGDIGLMGALANAALAANGEVIGVIPEKLMDLERGHTGVTELHVVADMHVRKRLMMEMADAFIVMPGGAGTMEELFEVWTWNQLGYHDKPCGILNVNGYYDALLTFINDAVLKGFIAVEAMDSLLIDDTVDSLLAQLERRTPKSP